MGGAPSPVPACGAPPVGATAYYVGGNPVNFTDPSGEYTKPGTDYNYYSCRLPPELTFCPGHEVGIGACAASVIGVLSGAAGSIYSAVRRDIGQAANGALGAASSAYGVATSC